MTPKGTDDGRPPFPGRARVLPAATGSGLSRQISDLSERIRAAGQRRMTRLASGTDDGNIEHFRL
jgi:hypothetical protein